VAIGSFPESSVEKIDAGDNVRFRIVDPQIENIIAKFPFLAVNGRKQRVMVPNIKTRKPEYIDVKSYTIRIPREKKDADVPGAYDSSFEPQPK